LGWPVKNGESILVRRKKYIKEYNVLREKYRVNKSQLPEGRKGRGVRAL